MKNTATLSEKEYQTRELRAFLNSSHAFHDSTKEFAAVLNAMDLDEQIEWVENGSYGAGACLALQSTIANLTPRMNARAAVGGVILHAFHGKPFRYWTKLPAPVQEKLNAAVDAFLARPHEFATILIP